MRVLVGKVGLDGHDRGVHMLAFELRNQGAEVVMLGVGTTPEHLAHAALQEDVDVVGVSILSGAHLVLVPEVMTQMRKFGVEAPVACGGIIPPGDVPALLEAGVAAVAPLGTAVVDAAAVLLKLGAGTDAQPAAGDARVLRDEARPRAVDRT